MHHMVKQDLFSPLSVRKNGIFHLGFIRKLFQFVCVDIDETHSPGQQVPDISLSR